MSTAQDVIRSALRKLAVLDPDTTPSATEESNALEALNDMLRDWEADGIALGFSPLAATTDTLSVPDDALRAIKFNLAVEMAPDYGKRVGPVVATVAQETYRQLLGASMLVTEADQTHLPGVRHGFDIDNC